MDLSPLEGLARALMARLPHAREEILAVLNGAVGDRLATADSGLALPLALYEGCELVPVEASAPRPSRVCLFAHGLMGSQHAWSLGTEEGKRIEFGSAFDAELGVTPLYLRYNSGRHISTNGRELAHALNAYFAESKADFELDIVAHSMGGLVVRSAIHYAMEAEMVWPSRIERVFMLGTPNHGARLEQLAHFTAFTLESIWNPWTKLIGKAINIRAAGIKDLRHGYCLDADWQHKDQDELRLGAPRPTLAPPQARWFVIAGQLGREDDGWSWLLGDGLVRPKSAAGHGFGSPEQGVLPEPTLHVFERRGHLSLMNEPEVLTQIIDWWHADRAGASPNEIPPPNDAR